jgi:hypothetical protein
MREHNATVLVSSDDEGAILFRLSGDEGSRLAKFTVDPATLPPLSSSANVIQYGDAVRAALFSNPAVRAELERMFTMEVHDRARLEFAFTNSEGEPIRWEALYGGLDATQANNPPFLAVDDKCSLKRILFTRASNDSGPRTYLLPLRMVAFLSASGVTADAEFDAIAAAVGEARRNGLKLEAHVYVGEQELLDRALGAIAAGKLPGIRVLAIPREAIGIETALSSAPFQIVHFFCHGRVDGSVQRLEFASINDNDVAAVADFPRDTLTGSIPFSIDRLSAALSKNKHVWVTVLNSCQGGASAPRQHSMVRKLAKGASPVAIGMAEPIHADDATRFAAGFYRSAFDLIGQAIRGLKSGSSAEIDFGPAVGRARSELLAAAEQGDAERYGRWCLPVLYQTDAALRVMAHKDGEAMQARIDTVAGALRNLPAASPPELRNLMLAILDQEPPVPRELWPGPFGDFR